MGRLKYITGEWMCEGYGSDGFNTEGYDREGYDRDGYNKEGYDRDGFSALGWNRYGINKETGTKYDKEGYDINFIHKDTGTKYDKEGYDILGRNKDGDLRYGFKVIYINKETGEELDRNSYKLLTNGYYTVEPWDSKVINKETGIEYDKRGFRYSGWNKITESKYDVDGYDIAGYDKDGYDKDGYNRDGYNRNGQYKFGNNYEGSSNYSENGVLKIFLFDTETTGTDPLIDYIVQFGGISGILNTNTWEFKETSRINQLINVPIRIPQGASDVHHIYNKDLVCYDYIESYINIFLSYIKNADYVVGHNVNFDKRMLMGECKRLGIYFDFDSVKRFDTMIPTSELVGIRRSDGSYKWPKLIELHRFLFGRGFDDAHDAMADIIATKDCFIELCKNYNLFSLKGKNNENISLNKIKVSKDDFMMHMRQLLK